MNERIKELKDKLWTEEYWTNPNTDKLLPAQLNRFAELIVAECIDVFSKDLPEDSGKMLEVVNRVCNVAEHFGVEE